MNLHEAAAMLRSICQQPGHQIVPYLVGPPGCGKTAITRQVASEIQAHNPAYGYGCLNGPSCESVDVRGMPTIVDGATRWASPLPQFGRGLYVLDEISAAASDVQVAFHHVVRSEPGSDIRLGDDWNLVLTGNRGSDRNYFRALGAALRNRVTIVEIDVDSAITAQYMMDVPFVPGFLRWRPELCAAKEIPAEGAFPSPRAWESVGLVHQLAISAHTEAEMIRGYVGDGAATEYLAYLRLARELPSIERIKADQTGSQVPTSPSLLYALVTALTQYTRQTGESLARFVTRCPAEFALLYIRDVAGKLSLKADPDIRKWVAKHPHLFIEETIN